MARRKQKATKVGAATVRIGGTDVDATVLGTDDTTGQVQVSWDGGRAWVAPGDVTPVKAEAGDGGDTP